MILRSESSDDAMLSKEIVADVSTDVVRRILIQVGFAPIRLSPLLSILCRESMTGYDIFITFFPLQYAAPPMNFVLCCISGSIKLVQD